MRLRKYFNYPSKKEVILITEGCDKLVIMAKEHSRKHNTEESNRQKEKNGTCPNCGDKTIVNKITRVEGSGYVSGSFTFGFGNVNGSSTTDTNEVNHCNKCGNQWKKYDPNFTWTDDVIADWMNDLSAVFDGKYTYCDRTVELLKDIPAESLWKQMKIVSHKCFYSTRYSLTLSLLRTKFKSVYQ